MGLVHVPCDPALYILLFPDDGLGASYGDGLEAKRHGGLRIGHGDGLGVEHRGGLKAQHGGGIAQVPLLSRNSVTDWCKLGSRSPLQMHKRIQR